MEDVHGSHACTEPWCKVGRCSLTSKDIHGFRRLHVLEDARGNVRTEPWCSSNLKGSGYICQ